MKRCNCKDWKKYNKKTNTLVCWGRIAVIGIMREVGINVTFIYCPYCGKKLEDKDKL